MYGLLTASPNRMQPLWESGNVGFWAAISRPLEQSPACNRFSRRECRVEPTTWKRSSCTPFYRWASEMEGLTHLPKRVNKNSRALNASNSNSKVHAHKPGSTPGCDMPVFKTTERRKNRRMMLNFSNGCCFSPCAGPSLLEVNCLGSAAWLGGAAHWSRGARHQSSLSPWSRETRCPPVRHTTLIISGKENLLKGWMCQGHQ